MLFTEGYYRDSLTNKMLWLIPILNFYIIQWQYAKCLEECLLLL
jgi:hypothetical protein